MIKLSVQGGQYPEAGYMVGYKDGLYPMAGYETLVYGAMGIKLLSLRVALLRNEMEKGWDAELATADKCLDAVGQEERHRTLVAWQSASRTRSGFVDAYREVLRVFYTRRRELRALAISASLRGAMREHFTEDEKYVMALVVFKAHVRELSARIETAEETVRVVKMLALSDIEAFSASSGRYSELLNSLSEKELQASRNLPLKETEIGRSRLELVENRAARLWSSGVFERDMRALEYLRNDLKDTNLRIEELLRAKTPLSSS